MSDLEAIEGAKSALGSLFLSGIKTSVGQISLPNLIGLVIQRDLHALTGGPSAPASRMAEERVKSARGPMENGFAIHLLGDTYAHRILGDEGALRRCGRADQAPRGGISVATEIAVILQEAGMKKAAAFAYPARAQERFVAVMRSRIEALLGHRLYYRPERFDLSHLFGGRTSVSDVEMNVLLSETPPLPRNYDFTGMPLHLGAARLFSHP